MTINFDSLMIELTRFCNMECPHCIRGEMQRKRIKKETITATLEQFGEYIPTISFTGGEPALCLDLIAFTLEECKRLQINVGNFWMATNGIIHSKKLFDVITAWLEYCNDNELSGLRISIDNYHNLIDVQPFKEFEEELEYGGLQCDFEYQGATSDVSKLIGAGRAYDNGWGGDGNPVKHHTMLYGEKMEGEIYVNIFGNVITTCDISYEMQDEDGSDYNIGNVHESTLQEIYQKFFLEHPKRVNE